MEFDKVIFDKILCVICSWNQSKKLLFQNTNIVDADGNILKTIEADTWKNKDWKTGSKITNMF